MTQPAPNPTPGDPAPNPTNPPASPQPADPPKPPNDEPLREPGKKALEEERARVKALERQLGELAPLKQLAEMLGGKPTGDGKTDLERLTERLAQHETELAQERQARWRAEVAADKKLPPGLAARLRGDTREALERDADELLALIPEPAGPRIPAPDPSQGARGGTPPDLDAEIADAQKSGDWRKVMRLQNQKLAALAAQQQ